MYLATEPMLRKKRGVPTKRRAFASVGGPGISPNAM
ncbi:hypothetical protein RESH_01078 [Rhodopirellula europaea SH398]|uniref:Uncharacterized protein n=1 Tax=Rhodopirellula europaea SH398 TaxID=1263868 RepID=M5SA88_9BACT|nr:hypothetical protein RESH_01078 [Rhodopirellula europaea SH398]